MILKLLLISSLVAHSFALEVPHQGAEVREANDINPADLEGSGEEDMTKFDETLWQGAEKEMGWDDARKKRQANGEQANKHANALTEQQQPFEVQRSHDDSREDRRHRPDGPSCRTVRCTSGTECVIENGRPTCRPTRPQPPRSCRDINCPRDSRCRMERDRNCRDRHCPDLPVCVRESRPSCSNVQCPFGTRCRIVEEHGCRGRDCREVISCVPSSSNPCDGISCPFGTMCSFDGRRPSCTPLVIDRCLNARCPSGFQCRTVDNQARCFPSNGPTCGPNQVFAQCSSPCEPRCGQPAPTACIARCDPPRCQCAPGFWRHATGSCVQQHQCFIG